jgi:DNA-binding transcriptional ArsR family regulator
MPRATTTSDPFNAIAEPRRREILALLAEQEWPVADIATELDMGQPSVSKHLRVLLDTGLVEVRREGRHAFYRTNPMQIKAIHDWTRRFERYWTGQVLRIKARADRASSGENKSTTMPTTP